MQNPTLFKLDKGLDLSVAVSKGSSRKYPNVIWFPRSKTDLQEIREVLKLALQVQKENPDDFFNDKILGEKMARIGSINVVGKLGDDYVKSYKGKSTGDVSYITNARMLMRLFRFLGLVTRLSPAKYQLTDQGTRYAQFTGDFPSTVNGTNEEETALRLLSDFSFYCVNDDSAYRDSTFQVRPFILLLNSLLIEPQCIYQLIVTTFASKSESDSEIDRIQNLLNDLRAGKTDLKKEFKKVGLDADDYSCVHNFYDSAKILVYIGSKLGLITKGVNPEYGKKIAGNARNLKQATVFYELTEKGKTYLSQYKRNRLVYYSDLYKDLGTSEVLQAVFILASLNYSIGNTKIQSIHKSFFERIIGLNWMEVVTHLRTKRGIEIVEKDDFISLGSFISFNFWQSIPPELFHLPAFNQWYLVLKKELKDKSSTIRVMDINKAAVFEGKVVSLFILDKGKGIQYAVPHIQENKLEAYTKYPDMQSVYGGQDRFASRISPTNSVAIVGKQIHVDNDVDALDLLVPLQEPNDELREFIHLNIDALIQNFFSKSDNWEKDQHYTWVRNCFRLFGAEAIYSGSSGMLSRADVSVVDPFLGGIEVKSPRENRGSIATKAIRQAVDAKIQVADKFPEKKTLPRVSIAIGRRITPHAIAEEKKWRNEGQPVLLINDMVLYYLTLKTIDIPFDQEDIADLFTKNYGLLDKHVLLKNLLLISEKHKLSEKIISSIKEEIERLDLVIAGGVENGEE